MAGTCDGVTAVQIEIILAVARVDPDSVAAFGDDWHLLVRSQLKLVFRSHG
jgi:hypothetical protein